MFVKTKALRIPRKVLTLGVLAVLLLLAACVATLPGEADEAADDTGDTVVSTSNEVEQAVEEENEMATDVELLPEQAPPFSTTSWRTDFTRRTVPWNDILSGGPPKDGIPAIDDPTFEDIAAAGEWLSERDPVILFEEEGDVRAYPLAILIWHEIVNDTVGNKPVSVTFCPLCNASIVFDRTLDGTVLDFGTTGKLRNSDLIMYDRQSESWWQQFTGEGIVGEHTGRQLQFLPSQVISFGDFVAEFPDGQVLARPPAARSYGANPYVGYDSTQGQPFLFNGEVDDRLSATERVVGIDMAETTVAYPFSTVEEAGVINDELNGMPIAVMHKTGTASALDDRQISEGRDIGSVAVYNRLVGDQVLTFEANGDGTFADMETGSTWNILGEAIDGEMAGTQLEQQIAFDHFWFAWTAFFPKTALYGS